MTPAAVPAAPTSAALTPGSAQPGSEQPGRGAKRLTALDGVRGIASLAVVFCHAMIVSPALDAAARGTDTSLSAWWLVFSPLHLAWVGAEAVWVFFVLSGFVLTLPFLAGDRSVPGYYARRLPRLYLPVVTAVLLAVVSTHLVQRAARPEFSEFVNSHAEPVTVMSVLRDVLLVTGTDELVAPLWSLRWEVIFTLLLPAVVVSRRIGYRPVLVSVACVATIAVGSIVGLVPALKFLPIFVIGVQMAVAYGSLMATAERTTRTGWAVITACALALLGCRWWMPGWDSPGLTAVSVVGAALLIFVFLGSPFARTIARSTPLQWLGRVSFSLYLVHEPIVVSVANLLRTTNPAVVIAVALPISLLMAEIFFRLVERPSYRLARRVGQRVGTARVRRCRSSTAGES